MKNRNGIFTGRTYGYPDALPFKAFQKMKNSRKDV